MHIRPAVERNYCKRQWHLLAGRWLLQVLSHSLLPRMSEGRWDSSDATLGWFTGTRGASQTCDAVCEAVLSSCGPTREDECPEPPSCVSEALEALWADTACAIHAEGRLDAGAVDVASCTLCGPSDYSNAFCRPGIIDSEPGTAYYGAGISGVSGTTLCAVQYTDSRVEPLCPCLLPVIPGSLGWLIVIWMGVAAVFYVSGGLAYGRYENPPAGGAKSLDMTHPSGEPFMNWHPHRWHWGELVELCYDGFGFTVAHLRRLRGDSDASYDPVAKGAAGGEGVDGDEESGPLTPKKPRRRSEPAAGEGRKKKRSSEGKEKKKKSPKPRPSRRKSEPAQLDDETKSWLASE